MKLKFCLLSIISAIALLAINQTANEYLYGQSDVPFANCILDLSIDSITKEPQYVHLEEDADCNEQQFDEAVNYYKANGYPLKSKFLDTTETKTEILESEQWRNEKEILEEWLER
jgi:hypothetical protein